MEIKERIKDICKHQGTTLRALAELVGTSENSLNNTLSKGNPTLDTMRKIATALNVPISSLIDDPLDKKHDAATCPHCGNTLHISIS